MSQPEQVRLTYPQPPVQYYHTPGMPWYSLQMAYKLKRECYDISENKWVPQR